MSTIDKDDVEAVARAIDPMAFAEEKHAPRGLEGARPFLLLARKKSMQHRARRDASRAIAALIERGWVKQEKSNV